MRWSQNHSASWAERFQTSSFICTYKSCDYLVPFHPCLLFFFVLYVAILYRQDLLNLFVLFRVSAMLAGFFSVQLIYLYSFHYQHWLSILTSTVPRFNFQIRRRIPFSFLNSSEYKSSLLEIAIISKYYGIHKRTWYFWSSKTK